MADTEATLLAALHQDPADETCWLALADWLEEAGQNERSELTRLHRWLRGSPARSPHRRDTEQRVRQLLAGGVRPCVPEVVNSLGMRLALVGPGAYWMGAPQDDRERGDEERPRHEVVLTRPFYLGVFAVTQEEYERVTGSNPAAFSPKGGSAGEVRGLETRRFPVETVTWLEAAAFCERLSGLPGEKAAGRVYRLPTEAEWEYACRGGYSWLLAPEAPAPGTANFDGNYPLQGVPRGPYLQRPAPVGSYAPNALGLYDMQGNVWEWCADWFAPDYYRRSPKEDPPGPTSGTERLLRGGAWYSIARRCRPSFRDSYVPDRNDRGVGFRVAMEARA